MQGSGLFSTDALSILLSFLKSILSRCPVAGALGQQGDASIAKPRTNSARRFLALVALQSDDTLLLRAIVGILCALKEKGRETERDIYI